VGVGFYGDGRAGERLNSQNIDDDTLGFISSGARGEHFVRGGCFSYARENLFQAMAMRVGIAVRHRIYDNVTYTQIVGAARVDSTPALVATRQEICVARAGVILSSRCR